MVTIETKVWEKDWEFLLKGDYLRSTFEVNHYDFVQRQVIINNVKNRRSVEKYCEKKINEGVIDKYFVVEDFKDEVLNYFDISYDSFKGGFNYSIAELLGLFKCETKYLLHFSGDSFLSKNAHNWVVDAIKVMEKDDRIIVANPTWNAKFEDVKRESISEIEKFYLGYGFSDQAYLVRVGDFKGRIYNEKNKESDRYPSYGGELFEKRVDAFMRNHERLRITHKFSSYFSSNLPRSWISRKIFRSWITKDRLKRMNSNY